jgi:hypothetical protein
MSQNHSAGSLAFASGNHSAHLLGFASGVGGFGRKRGGRSTRPYRDFVASANG